MKSVTPFRKWLGSNTQAPFVARPDSQEAFYTALPEEVGDKPWLWMKTSGTTSTQAEKSRWIAHTRESLLCSAASVCQWLSAAKADRWGRVLTQAHMGGLSIDVRAHVAGFSIIDADFDWDAQVFLTWVSKNEITLLSLVPTQVFDLCRLNLKAPAHLRHVVIGGDRLDDDLSQKAIALGWPVLRSYGLTETASMIACQDSGLAQRKPSAFGRDLEKLKFL